MKTATVDGKSIGYDRAGEGIPVVLLHGWPQTSFLWRKIVPRLAQGYEVIVVDLPGIGESDCPEGFDTKTVATLLCRVLTSLGVERFHLVGHDVGAWVAASVGIHYEDRLLSLTVVDAGIPGLIPDDLFQPQNAPRVWQFYFHAIADLPEQLIRGKEREYLSWYFRTKSVVAGAISDEAIDHYVDVYSRGATLGSGFGYYRSFTTSAHQNRSFTGTLTIPVLAVGAQSGVGPGIGVAMAKIATRTTTAVVEACGHYIPEEQPDVFCDLLVRFLADA